MKLCFSRKGFDSQYGRIPSPILPDGRIVPLPIPAAHDDLTMKDVDLEGVDLEGLLSDLSRGRLSIATHVHLDPDLDRAADHRLPGWRPALGQTGSAQGHLARQRFGVGDIFLFFGWFRRVERTRDRWRYAPLAPNLHVIFGWLEVAEVLPIVTQRAECLSRHPWIAAHPHVAKPDHYNSPLNHLYIAGTASRYAPHSVFAAGRFTKFNDLLRLSAEGYTRTVWRLPGWFMPGNARPPLSYHPEGDCWVRDDECVLLRSAAKGQEFVLDAEYYPEAQSWLRTLLAEAV
ncbi:hypothetical protein M3I54_40395 [Paraburkholderia sp. CNPSo 3274]|uniref:Nmad3 family putative nucleotide modification protein n=1 Tax=Paraburkholderia sp. CNPSo 3274 TaxID=2940932 RepID=UPI0020B7F221|nr:hypothetical protein [Paraburkholderia sp. CNPSo 3274]MCP3713073.1 hypothetical protein [Paraburkholderia sp. CNPSo 3274]